MAEDTIPAAVERIERAIARIEAAVTTREQAQAALAERHEALRMRIGDAIHALDAVIAGETPDEADSEPDRDEDSED